MNEGLRKIRRALISVSDKTGIIEFARELQSFGVEIISTGGTARALRDAMVEVRDISDVTGFPEMMDGRIKTLHPRIHGGLLALRDNEEHLAAMNEHGIEPIDMVVVNLYPFEQTVAREGVTLEEAIEQIDIGGPAMIRSAAKNFRDVAVVVEPAVYPMVISQMKNNGGSISWSMRAWLVQMAFQRTAAYDAAIFKYLNSTLSSEAERAEGNHTSFTMIEFFKDKDSGERAPAKVSKLFPSANFSLGKKLDLRYGENPHQLAALYGVAEESGIANAELLSGKEMSFNNYMDADAAWNLVCDFDELACAIIKHTNPAGVGTGASGEEAYRRDRPRVRLRRHSGFQSKGRRSRGARCDRDFH